MREDTLVYFLATADRTMVKIGCSYLPDNRRQAIQTWPPVKLEVIAAAPGGIEDERALHARFLQLRSHGEWFKGHSSIYAVAAEIKAAGKIPDHLRGSHGQKSPFHMKKRVA